MLSLDSVGDNAQGECFDFRTSLGFARAIRKHTRKLLNFGDPPTVVFPIEHNLKFHGSKTSSAQLNSTASPLLLSLPAHAILRVLNYNTLGC